MKNRTFILGLIFLIFGAIGLADHLQALRSQTWVFDAWNILSFLSDCGLLYLAFIKIDSTTK